MGPSQKRTEELRETMEPGAHVTPALLQDLMSRRLS